MYMYCECTMYILFMYIHTYIKYYSYTMCVYALHVSYYGQEGTNYGRLQCIQLIRVICVTRTCKDFEYSDTNEIIKS